MASDSDVDRRAYLAAVGAAGVAGLAGCPGDPRDGDGDGGGGTGTPTDDGTGGEDAVRLATAADFPPFADTQDGQLVGLDVDLAQAVVERAGYEVGTWVDIRFEALVQELNAEQFDLVAAATSVALDRGEEVAFSTSYHETDQAVIVAADGEFQPEAEADLEGRFVGAQAGTTCEALVERLIEEEVLTEDDYRPFVDFTRALEALTEENLDAVVVDRPTAETVAEEYDATVAFEVQTDEEYALAMRSDDDRFEAVDEALTEVLEDGTYDELVAEHLEGGAGDGNGTETPTATETGGETVTATETGGETETATETGGETETATETGE